MTDRGVSVAVNYVLTLVIVTTLVSTLLISTNNVVEERRTETVQTELKVLGQRTAAAVMATDRLATTGPNEATTVIELPSRVAGLSYHITVNASQTDSHILLETTDPSIVMRVRFANTTPVENSTLNGGDLRIRLASDGELEVRRA